MNWESSCNCCLLLRASLSLSHTSTVSPYKTYFCSSVLPLSIFFSMHFLVIIILIINVESQLMYDSVYIFISHHIFPLCSIKSLVLQAGVSVSWSHCSRIIWGQWWNRSSSSVLWDPNPAEESQLTPWVLMSSSPLWKKRQAKTTREVTWRSYSMRPVIFSLWLFTCQEKTSFGLLWTSVFKTQLAMPVFSWGELHVPVWALLHDRLSQQNVFYCTDGHLLRWSCRMANVPHLHVSALQAYHRRDAGL